MENVALRVLGIPQRSDIGGAFARGVQMGQERADRARLADLRTSMGEAVRQQVPGNMALAALADYNPELAYREMNDLEQAKMRRTQEAQNIAVQESLRQMGDLEAAYDAGIRDYIGAIESVASAEGDAKASAEARAAQLKTSLEGIYSKHSALRSQVGSTRGFAGLAGAGLKTIPEKLDQIGDRNLSRQLKEIDLQVKPQMAQAALTSAQAQAEQAGLKRQELAQNVESKERQLKGEAYDVIKSVSADVLKTDEGANYNKVVRWLASIDEYAKAAKEGNPAAAQAIYVLATKANDPNSAVLMAEGEAAQDQSTASKVDAWVKSVMGTDPRTRADQVENAVSSAKITLNKAAKAGQQVVSGAIQRAQNEIDARGIEFKVSENDFFQFLPQSTFAIQGSSTSNPIRGTLKRKP